MCTLTPLMARIMQLKGDGSFADLSDAIFNKTGKRLSANGLQHLASGNREGRPNTIKILARFADKSVSWFYEVEQSSSIAEARAEYLIPTGDPEEDYVRREILTAFDRDIKKLTRDPTLDDIKILASLAKELVKRRKSGTKQ